LAITLIRRGKSVFIKKSAVKGVACPVKKAAQHSVHPTLGILARFQAFFYASTFSQSDGVPPPAPARVTQAVSQLAKS
jgi:hypothetical protein